MIPFLLATMVAAASPLETAPRPQVAPLTDVQAIRRLSPEECARRRPVRISGVVTFVNSAKVQDFFVQDAAAGIYIAPSDYALGLKIGDRVQVLGVTDPGDFAPCVVPSAVEVQGHDSPLPMPLPFTMAPQDGRWLDGQYVQAWGVISGVRANDAFTIISLYNAQGRANILLPDPKLAGKLQRIKDTAVSICGVCVPSFDAKEHIIKNDFTRIYANYTPLIPLGLDEPQASQAIDHLLRFRPAPHPGARRVIVTGVVVANADGVLYVQDATGGVAVKAEAPAAEIPVGQRVEVTGLLSIEGRRIALVHAKVKTLGDDAVPAPVAAEPADLAQGRYHARLVMVAGRVDQIEPHGEHLAITLVDGATRFDAFAPADTEPPPVGSRIQVTGVPGASNAPAGFALWLRTSGDLQVLARPAAVSTNWWTPMRIFAIVMLPFASAAAAFAWVVTLRRQARRQASVLRHQFETQAELEDRLRTSAKLEAIGRLAGGIAHDFNNLLTVINGCGELLANELPPDSVQHDLAKDIRSAGERAASLVSQLLLFSRRQAVRLQTVDLQKALREAERILRRVIGEAIIVQCEVSASTPPVRAEVTLIHQIILNLAVNARDAMPVGGTLRIAAKREEGPHGPVARLSVSDTGVGMDDATRKRIFEPFFTTKGVGAGTGLGLATVYGIVQTLNGEICCRSAVGQGTTFEIDIPAANAAAAVNSDGSASRPVTAGRGTILVCEDDDAVRELTCRILETAGYAVLAAETPTDAAKLAQTHPGSIELLLTDIVMPELNGRELAELIQPLRPDMRIVYMTGYTSEEMQRQGVAAEEVTVIGKPFSAAALTAKIDEVLHQTLAEFELPAGIA